MNLISRWMHAICQNLNTEEDVENTADSGFDCTMCRPYIPPANGKKFLREESQSIALGWCFFFVCILSYLTDAALIAEGSTLGKQFYLSCTITTIVRNGNTL